METNHLMSSPDHPAVLRPSWKSVLGLLAVTVGYLVVLLGIVVYTWGELHTLYGVPVLAAPVVGLLVAVGGGLLVWRERA